jgi:hypothetical protein
MFFTLSNYIFLRLFIPFCDVRHHFRVKIVWFVLTPICFVGGSCFIYYLQWFLYWHSTLFLFQIMFVSFKRNMTWATSRTRNANFSAPPEITPYFSAVCVARSSLLSVVFCRPLFAGHLSHLFRSLHDGFWLNLRYLQSCLNSIWKLTFWYSIIQFSDFAYCFHCMTLNT